MLKVSTVQNIWFSIPEDMDDVAEIQDLLMEDISSDGDSDSDPEEMVNALMEDNDLSEDDLIELWLTCQVLFGNTLLIRFDSLILPLQQTR